MTPIKMEPFFQDYLWGGTKLVDLFGKLTDLRPVAESWEISCHPSGLSKIASGAHKGMSLAEALAENPHWLGTGWSKREFPILIKLIDAAQSLSVQVHPNDEYAQIMEKQLGKNEMWYVVDAIPGAEMVIGCRDGISAEDLRRGIQDNTLMDMVIRVPVKAGDCYQIPGGMLHAIGAGILVAEIQQNSNLTYRVYDYGRVDVNGTPRTLHVDKALAVVRPELKAFNMASAPLEQRRGYHVKKLTNWEYFTAELLEIEYSAHLECGPEGFQCLLVLAGRISLVLDGELLPLKAGESVFIPADTGEYLLQGPGRALCVK